MHAPDRQKQRREYLGKKAKLIVGILLGTCVGLINIGFLVKAIDTYQHIRSDSSHSLQSLSVVYSYLLCSFGCTMVLKPLVRFAKQAEHQVNVAPYVPPFTPDTLPADEVLVRASQEPTQEQSTVLLRAAEESADTPSELLGL